ncbi:lysylphosphatidylglycerol biosynthesis bifunctional protein LysX [Penicillium digitatum]|uniref:Phosphatidylglycerol lysyltransferase C-terminal domain-containing protein n=3 Tax=Penicillium digitatum TaxID=36651 RepID=K9GFG3_PEND2|nr:hypothetical protein PDIP_02470 [Penicillium digitatum Pd1]EKV19907.1 hypothetical protein PDIG_00190 [Penicillium digitatum PHI26]EKV21843.1 hypothetical protein PDIP_02470 [Penicillium digitatum Pd1]QQK47681.1 lysylphosphatidylglycerol biosynthesis bifunctional protein LysX [Penicillium digitatum]
MTTPTGSHEPTADKKRTRRIRKGNLPGPVTVKPKKTLFVDEIGDSLVDGLYETAKRNGDVDNLAASSISLWDHLRSSTGPPAASSCSSSASFNTLSDSSPATSVNSHEPLPINSLQVPTTVKVLNPTTDSLHAKAKGQDLDAVFGLEDFKTVAAIQQIAAQYGQVAHMGILDHSYRFFVNKSRTAAISFKVQNGVAVIGGDPLCHKDEIPELLSEFAAYRQRHHLSIAFMGASESFLKDYAKPNGWTTIRFATERVLNPQTNEVILENSGKRILTKSRQLTNKTKGGITMGVYAPAVHGINQDLQSNLIAVYDAWRAERNASASPQAFITVYDPFAVPALMTFIYTRTPDRTINGFAALRRLGAGGYHVDPYIAAPGSVSGISDLLLVMAMALLRRAGVSYLGLGVEPLQSLNREDVSGMPWPCKSFTRGLYGHAFQRLPIGGKKAYHDKFRPDATQDAGLYLVFPSGIPSPRHMLAMTHMANISLRKIFRADVESFVLTRKLKAGGEVVVSLGKKEGSAEQSKKGDRFEEEVLVFYSPCVR